MNKHKTSNSSPAVQKALQTRKGGGKSKQKAATNRVGKMLERLKRHEQISKAKVTETF